MMRDELLGYYERELAFLRQVGADFAQKYPKIAGRLLLEADKCEDPHVERIIEAFAFLAARVRLKIDDEFPEVTESLLNVLYPHYLSPIPSMSIAQFSLDPQQGKLTTGYGIDRGTTLYSHPIQGTPCRFRTSYPVVLWPIEVVSAWVESLSPVDTRGKWPEAVIRISLRCINNTRLSELRLGAGERTRAIDSLRFYINGEAQLVYPLYEMIFNNASKVELRPSPPKRETGGLRPAGGLNKTPPAIALPPTSIRQVGFEADEAMLSYTARSFAGYRLLTEYFAFPDKFLFFDVAGLDQAARAGFGDQFDISIHLRDVTPPRSVVDADTFQLGCAPIINLFSKTAEPIQLTQKQSEYHVIADVHRQMATEIYSIDSVSATDPYLQQSRPFQPFYSFRHAYDPDHSRTFWYSTRRPSQRKDDAGTEIYLSLVDLGFNPHVPAIETITVGTTCTNRDLPSRLPFGGRDNDLEIESGAPISRVRCLKKPTNTIRPPLKRAGHWRLISHLALNHFSIVEKNPGDSAEALREILLLYDFQDSSATRKQILGINSVSSRRVVRQMGSRVGTGFVRGVEVTIDFDEDQYVGSGLFLFASVLDRFLALYGSINSFTQLVGKTYQSEGNLKRWPPRAGEQIIL
ncbi:MAG TPA: type VI secretion system baseplate subunit TssF [Blastocatellia bacterium]|nr:type VI secretion system baseplate subunit TssF [Blastocatellia bacterium]